MRPSTIPESNGSTTNPTPYDCEIFFILPINTTIIRFQEEGRSFKAGMLKVDQESIQEYQARIHLKKSGLQGNPYAMPYGRRSPQLRDEKRHERL